MEIADTTRIVDTLFERFALRWARGFLREYEGLDIGAVKQEWARELSRFSPEEIGQAYRAVKDNQVAPSLPTFVATCRAYRRQRFDADQTPALPPPSAVKRKIAAILAKRTDYRAWARELKARHDGGERLSPLQVRYYREALYAPTE